MEGVRWALRCGGRALIADGMGLGQHTTCPLEPRISVSLYVSTSLCLCVSVCLCVSLCLSLSTSYVAAQPASSSSSSVSLQQRYPLCLNLLNLLKSL